ncbi:MAG TPA: hypothetical protein VLA56_18485 [Pseudomonadales bacterium]|nr:hypothetical protein [Pseudomonadales bacterium]
MADQPGLMAFERRLRRAFGDYAADVDGPFDPRAIARTVTASRAQGGWDGRRLWGTNPRLLLVAMVGLVAALLATTVFVGARLLSDDRAVLRSMAEIDACQLLYRAIDGSDTSGPPLDRSPVVRGYDPRAHDASAASWQARACVYIARPTWDSDWETPHLFVRFVPTAKAEAEEVLGRDVPYRQTGLFGGYWDGVPGAWRTANAAEGWEAVAILAEPYFFVVTGPIVQDNMSEDFRRRAPDVVAAAVARDLGLGDIGLLAP